MHPFDRSPPPGAGAPRYCIVVKDELGVAYAKSFPGMKLTAADGKTSFVGPIVDQAHLHGVLRRIGALNLVLLSVNSVEEV
jgi:hypothetical protein